MMRHAFAHLPMRGDGQIIVNLGLIHRHREWQPYWRDWLEAMRRAGWLRFGLYVWDKVNGMPGASKGRLAPCFELLFHFCRRPRPTNKIKPCKWSGKPSKRFGFRLPSGIPGRTRPSGGVVGALKIPDDVLRVERHKVTASVSGFDHPAIFPWKLPHELILAFTQPGERVLDLFCGSGSTVIAAEEAGRVAFGMEIEPRYVDVIRKRYAWRRHGRGCDWQALTPAVTEAP